VVPGASGSLLVYAPAATYLADHPDGRETRLLLTCLLLTCLSGHQDTPVWPPFWIGSNVPAPQRCCTKMRAQCIGSGTLGWPLQHVAHLCKEGRCRHSILQGCDPCVGHHTLLSPRREVKLRIKGTELSHNPALLANLVSAQSKLHSWSLKPMASRNMPKQI
jgi:hypothetical protein